MNRWAAMPRNDSYLQNDIHAGDLLIAVSIIEFTVEVTTASFVCCA